MELGSRRDQFAYFLGFVARTRRKQLREAENCLTESGYQTTSPEMAFEFCPFNEDQEQVLRSYAIFENGKSSDLVPRMLGLIGEYLFLVSDFESPCCGDGRTFYERNSLGDIVLSCDRCGTVYSLDGKIMKKTDHKKMTKPDFVSLFGEGTALNWPFHMKLRELLVHSGDR